MYIHIQPVDPVGFLAYRAKDALVLVRSFPDGVAKIVARDDGCQVVRIGVDLAKGWFEIHAVGRRES